MIEGLLCRWETIATQDETALVIPDGCRDLILKTSKGAKPQWFFSDLESCTYQVPVSKGDQFIGYRFKPGALIAEEKVLTLLGDSSRDPEQTLSLLNDQVSLSYSLDEALKCLASGVESVDRAAGLLGVSSRTLQRHVHNKTGKSPVFWHRLARVRRAGRATVNEISLAEVAYDFGFSDQAHMSREFRHWLGATPKEIKQGADQARQLLEIGYA